MRLPSRRPWRPFCLVTCVLALGCDGSGPGLETWARKPTVDSRLLGRGAAFAGGGRPQLPPHVLGTLQPLGGEAPLLLVNGEAELVVLTPELSGRTSWTLPAETAGLYLRLGERPFPASPCPPAASSLEVGAEALEAADGFSHPIRGVYGPGFPFPVLDPRTDPVLSVGTRHFLQGCVIDWTTRLFTGAGTNTVAIDLAVGLPDLRVKDVRVLRTRGQLGRLWIAVDDYNAALEREIRSDTFSYEIVATPPAGSPAPALRHRGNSRLAAGGWAWIVPGAGTPGDTSGDFRLPDDGRFYDVEVTVNADRAIPETIFDNNTRRARLRTRAQPAVVGIEAIEVRENCDAWSPGDWLLMIEVAHGGSGEAFLTDETMDVDDDRVYEGPWGFRLRDTDPDVPVRIRLGAVDCDWDSPATFLLTDPIGAIWAASSIEAHCGGEEWHEVGGREDLAGWAQATLTSDDRAAGTTVRVPASEENCGREAFTARFAYLTPEEATARGYRILADFDLLGGE